MPLHRLLRIRMHLQVAVKPYIPQQDPSAELSSGFLSVVSPSSWENTHISILSVHAIQRGHQLTKTSAAVGPVVSSNRSVLLYQPLPQVSLSSHASLQHSMTSVFSEQGRDKGRFAR